MDGEMGAWRDMVLREIGRQNSHLERLECSHTELLVEVGKLRVWAGIWGAVAGIAATAAAHIIFGG